VQVQGLSIKCARVGDMEIPNNKRIEYSLQYIHGVGRSRARHVLCWKTGYMAPVLKQLRHKTGYMASGDNRGQKGLLASPQYASVPDLRQNMKNNRDRKPLLYW